MNNLRNIEGEPEPDPKIRDMRTGEVGYTVEWAIDEYGLNEDYSISPVMHGTANVKVTCIRPGLYDIEYLWDK